MPAPSREPEGAPRRSRALPCRAPRQPRQSITPTGWSGELARLTLDSPDIAKLSLREPARVVLDYGDFSIGRACLAEDPAELCVEANLDKAGALQARYSFEQVSLALANALAPDAMPGQLRGELAGEGDIRRTADRGADKWR